MADHSQASPHIARQKKLIEIMKSQQLDSLILNPGPSMVYLTGLHFHLSERPVLVIFTPHRTPVIVLPELEQEKIKHLPFDLQAFPYGEDPLIWGSVFKAAAKAANISEIRNGVEPRHLRYLEFNLLSEAAPEAKFVSAESSVSQLRMYKDVSELAYMRKAVDIAQQALENTLQFIKIERTEQEVAAELTLQLLRAGSDPEIPFSPIVSSGLNGANPHATPSKRKLAAGDLLVIDWGASYQGYISDITRTFAIGKIDPQFEKIYLTVLDANTAGRLAAKPGITAETVDQATRAVIESAGYGKYFTHRTGHGVGMEGHEDPYIRAGNLILLEPGMTFTIEPGIYLPGRNGVRIEDDVVITPDGAESLTSYPRELKQLD
jgi:Xaa-Pro dipeptidase